MQDYLHGNVMAQLLLKVLVVTAVSVTFSLSEVINPCDSNPCQRNGLCIQLNMTDFVCLCPLGVEGKVCDEVNEPTESLSPCDPNPCLRGGACFPLNETDFLCLCPIGVAGVICDEIPTTTMQTESLSPCDPNPCLRGGACFPLNETDFLCLCPIGVAGVICDEIPTTTMQTESFGPCDLNPCLRGGACFPLNETDFLCLCPIGVAGVLCDEIPTTTMQTESLSPCDPNPCLRGGACFPLNETDFLCLCPIGVAGVICDEIPTTTMQTGTQIILTDFPDTTDVLTFTNFVTDFEFDPSAYCFTEVFILRGPLPNGLILDWTFQDTGKDVLFYKIESRINENDVWTCEDVLEASITTYTLTNFEERSIQSVRVVALSEVSSFS